MKPLNLAIAAALFLGSVSHAATLTYVAVLNAANENNPSDTSTATGNAAIIVNTIAQTIEVQAVFQGLTSPDTASHIHCCAPLGTNAGVATVAPAFPGFPLGVTAGSYDMVLDLTSASTYLPNFVTAQGGVANAEATLLAGLAAGTTYFNIHTTNFPGGEIRGQLTATPEPATFLLAGAVLAGLVLRRRVRLG